MVEYWRFTAVSLSILAIIAFLYFYCSYAIHRLQEENKRLKKEIEMLKGEEDE